MVEHPKIGLYVIGGHYTNPSYGSLGEQPEVAFGGYFKTKPSEEATTIVDLRGEIVDMWGPAKIEGAMSEGKIAFNKRYEDPNGDLRREEVRYRLEKDGDRYTGTYTIHPDLYERPVIAVVTPVSEDAYDILGRPIRRRGE